MTPLDPIAIYIEVEEKTKLKRPDMELELLDYAEK
jgi:hypothetical protein